MAVTHDTYVENGRWRQYLEKRLLEFRRQGHFGEGCWVDIIEPERVLTKRAELGPAERSEYRGHSFRGNGESEDLRSRYSQNKRSS